MEYMSLVYFIAPHLSCTLFLLKARDTSLHDDDDRQRSDKTLQV